MAEQYLRMKVETPERYRSQVVPVIADIRDLGPLVPLPAPAQHHEFASWV